jgi:hypothetical protein
MGRLAASVWFIGWFVVLFGACGNGSNGDPGATTANVAGSAGASEPGSNAGIDNERVCLDQADCEPGEVCAGQLGCGRPRVCRSNCGWEPTAFCNCGEFAEVWRDYGSCPKESFSVLGGCPVSEGKHRRCTTSAECLWEAPHREVCEGLGCGTGDGYCASYMGEDNVYCPGSDAEFCGCDGVTFSAKASCPRRRFESFGPCTSARR